MQCHWLESWRSTSTGSQSSMFLVRRIFLFLGFTKTSAICVNLLCFWCGEFFCFFGLHQTLAQFVHNFRSVFFGIPWVLGHLGHNKNQDFWLCFGAVYGGGSLRTRPTKIEASLMLSWSTSRYLLK